MSRVEFDFGAIKRLYDESRQSGTRGIGAFACAMLLASVFSVNLAHNSLSSGFLPREGVDFRRVARMESPPGFDSTESEMMYLCRGMVVASAAALAGTTEAAELLVPEQFPTVELAVSAANPGDVISVAAGIYDIGSLVLPDLELVIRGRTSASETVFRGVDIQVLGGASVRSIANITLRDCSGYGALRVSGSTVNLESVNLESNQVHAVFLDHNATLNTTNCRIVGNARGGFVYVNCMWNATDCVFESNGYTTAYGGAVGIHVGSGCNFTRCSFIGNASAQGGAIGLSFSGNRVFDDCYFEGNQSEDGAVWWTEFGATGVLRNSRLCGHSPADLHGSWIDGGGNQFLPDGCTPPCPADVVADGTVNGADLAIILNFWGTDGSAFAGVDVDGNGIVNGADIAVVLNAWGDCPL